MRLFLHRLHDFAVVVAAYCLVALLTNHWLFNRLGYVPPEDAEILVLGDSHVVTALDPALIPRAANIASSAEPLIVTRQKLEAIFPRASSVRTVIVAVGHHSFAPFQDTKFQDPQWAGEMMSRYYPILDLRQLIGRVKIDSRRLTHMSPSV